VPETHQALVHRYIAVWNLPDDERRPAIDDLFTEDVAYVDPLVSLSGRTALDTYIGLTRQRFPGMEFSSSDPADGHHDQVRFGWQCAPPGGPPALTGLDVALLADGRVRSLHGFFNGTPVSRPS